MSNNEAPTTSGQTLSSIPGYPFPSTSRSTTSHTTLPNPLSSPDATTAAAPPSSASALADAIDDFLGDLEKKFRTVSDEILGKLDDMAERCDRLEAEIMQENVMGSEKGKNVGAGSVREDGS